MKWHSSLLTVKNILTGQYYGIACLDPSYLFQIQIPDNSLVEAAEYGSSIGATVTHKGDSNESP